MKTRKIITIFVALGIILGVTAWAYADTSEETYESEDIVCETFVEETTVQESLVEETYVEETSVEISAQETISEDITEIEESLLYDAEGYWYEGWWIPSVVLDISNDTVIAYDENGEAFYEGSMMCMYDLPANCWQVGAFDAWIRENYGGVDAPLLTSEQRATYDYILQNF